MAVTRRKTGDTCWQIAAEWEPLVIGPGGLRLEEWLADGRAQVVKHGASRTVYRVDLPDRTLFLKHYRCRHLLLAARHLCRRSAARREWIKSRAIAARHIPTATPIACGEQQRGGLVRDNFFLTEAIAGGRTLEDCLEHWLPSLPALERASAQRALLVALARLAASVHRAGVDHDDFHAGNVLVQWPPAAERERSVPRLFLIDVPKVRLRAPLGWRRSRHSLAMLASGLWYRTTRSQRWRFWRTYLQQRPDLQYLDPRRAADELARCCLDHTRRIQRGRDKRPWFDNADFYRLRGARHAAHAVRDVPPAQLVRLAADPATLLACYFDKPVKLSHESVVVEGQFQCNDSLVPVAIKRYRPRNLWKWLLSYLRCDPARVGFARGQALVARGIATARPLAVVDARRGNRRRESYLVTEWLPGGLNLHLYAWQLAERPLQERRLRTGQVAERLGRVIGRMHAWQIGHRDLKGCNLLVVERAEDVEVYLIDLDGLRIMRRLSGRRRARDLARLAASCAIHPWVSRTDRLRFLRAYLRAQATPLDRSEWKRLWRRTAQAMARIECRLQRQGRPLA